MIIYPAIDLRNGKVVRLKEGDPNQQTLFHENPVETAKEWIAQGAEYLHIVNLDGAFETENENLSILKEIAQLEVKVQFGGGIRSEEAIQQALDLGASRVVLGTIAVKNPALVAQAVEKHGAEKICVALDAREGLITTNGWQHITHLTPIDFGKQLAKFGVEHELFADVCRHGMMSGSNVSETIRLGQETGLKVIASGGVSRLDEIHLLASSGYVAGAVIGMALYTNELRLKDAIVTAQAAL
ncbi:1-(5-phosphoribosyl)-5-[(5-phosphoribosylamino)me thylideneamino]imidazole-4-carboxamide isomerase [Anaerolineales bacterium]